MKFHLDTISLVLVISSICRLVLWTNRISNPGRVRNFYILQNVQTDSEAHLASYSVGTGDTSPDGTQRDVKLRLVSAEVNNEWTSCPSVCCMVRTGTA